MTAKNKKDKIQARIRTLIKLIDRNEHPAEKSQKKVKERKKTK
jgi:hypothetical protein